jgi:hypothetical protein
MTKLNQHATGTYPLTHCPVHSICQVLRGYHIGYASMLREEKRRINQQSRLKAEAAKTHAQIQVSCQPNIISLHPIICCRYTCNQCYLYVYVYG